MKLARCPMCHYEIDLESLVKDETGRELLAIVSKLNSEVASGLLAYIGLFRPAKSALSNGRALRLIKEVLALSDDLLALEKALVQTAQQIFSNRAATGDTKALSNHNYLKKVLANIYSMGNTYAISKSVNPSTDKQNKIGHELLDINNTDWAD